MQVRISCCTRFDGGNKSIVESLRRQVIEELHKGHLGVSKIKAKVHSRFGWPGLLMDLGEASATSSECVQLWLTPARAPLPPWP